MPHEAFAVCSRSRAQTRRSRHAEDSVIEHRLRRSFRQTWLCALWLFAGLGGCDSDPAGPDNRPQPPGEGWSDVTLGFKHTCALRNDGVVFCWGENSAFQVSSDTVPRTLAPERVTLPFVATDVEVAEHGSCASDASGRYHCWGLNRAGRLGILQDTLWTPTPMAGPSFESVRLGPVHSCGLEAGGQAHCWGGIGSTPDRQKAIGSPVTQPCLETAGYLSVFCAPAPVAVTLPEAALTIEPGVFYTCALGASGTAYCWGYDLWGALGGGGIFDPTPGNGSWYDARPVTGSLRFRELAVGNVYACGLDFSGAAFCWGADLPGDLLRTGQTGTGDDWQELGSRAPEAVAGGISFTSIGVNAENSIHAAHTCGVAEGGALYCWGSNEYGELGVPNASARCWQDKPCETAPVLVSEGPFRSVVLGLDHSCALTTDERLFCWGRNDAGQLGLGDTNDRSDPTFVPATTDP